MILARPRLSLLLVLAFVGLSGCARPSLQDSAVANDAQCRGYGFEAGSARYTECRRMLDRRSAIIASRPPGSGDPTGLPIYMPPPDMPSPREQGCLTVPISGQLFTNCP